MINDAQKVIFCVLKKIKYKADLTPDLDLGEKRIILHREDWGYRVAGCSIRTHDDLERTLGVLKQKKIIVNYSYEFDGMGGSYCEILLDKDFNEHFKKFEEKIESYAEARAKEITSIPFCMTEKGWGYLKFGKFDEKIKIGKINSRHFRLLQFLLEPFGIAKTTEAIYEWIKLPKDKKDSDLSGWDNYKKKNRQITIIQNTIKELQKGNRLRRKLAFEFDNTKSKIWIKSLE